MLADGVLLEGRGKVDRGVDRSGGGVSRFAAVHRVGLEPESLEIGLARHRDLTASPVARIASTSERVMTPTGWPRSRTSKAGAPSNLPTAAWTCSPAPMVGN